LRLPLESKTVAIILTRLWGNGGYGLPSSTKLGHARVRPRRKQTSTGENRSMRSFQIGSMWLLPQTLPLSVRNFAREELARC